MTADQQARMESCKRVRQVWHLLTDERSRAAVEVAERHILGRATDDELAAAFDGAWQVASGLGWDVAALRHWDCGLAASHEAAKAAALTATWTASSAKSIAEWVAEAERDAAGRPVEMASAECD